MGERESPGLCACKSESASAASSMLDEILLLSSLSTSRCEAVSAAMRVRIETLPTPPRPADSIIANFDQSKKATKSGFRNVGNLPVFALASANPLRQRRACSTKPCLRPAWTQNDSSVKHQIKNHPKGGLLFGGGGGNRTRVQRSSTDSSTYLVLSFNLIHLSRTHTLQVNESPFI